MQNILHLAVVVSQHIYVIFNSPLILLPEGMPLTDAIGHINAEKKISLSAF